MKIIDLYNHARGLKGFDYDQISDEIFIGTNMCCQFGFHRELLSKGVRADISLEKEKIDAPVGVDYFLWLPTNDGEAPTQDALLLGVQTLDFFSKKKIKTYIHCKNGHGRAPTLYLAYLIYKGADIQSAIASLESRRPSIHLNEIQTQALKKFEQSPHLL